MSDERWNRMWDIFHEVRDLPEEERPAALVRACGGDDGLLSEIERLLGDYDAPPTAIARDDLPSLDDVRVGDRIGPYRVAGVVGEGGMGVVYRAEQVDPVRRTVALKLIRPGLDSREVLSRFEAERQVLALLEHENIARVFDAGSTDRGRPYFAMEFVAGKSLVEYCDDRQLGMRARLELFTAVCAGVEHAHRRGVIHRDLKPTNVLVATVDGRPVPKIIDFGVARATTRHIADRSLFTEVGRLIGTPEYMSPEQAGLTGADIDTRTDVYALGVLLYELLTGVRPFDSRSLREAGYDEMLRIIREIDPPRPSTRVSSLGADAGKVAESRRLDGVTLERRLRGDLDCIVMKALEKDRDRRYGSPGALADDIDRLRENHPIEARPPSAAYRAKKFVRRHRVGVAAAAAVVVAVVAGVATGAVGLVRARAAEQEARVAEAEARREARVAEEVSDFLTDLFEVSRPGSRAADSLTARQVLDLGSERVRTFLEEDPEIRAEVLSSLGKGYAGLGRYEEAKELYEEALELGRQLEKEPGPKTAWALNLMGAVAFQAGDIRKALEYYEQAFAIDEATLGPDHPSTLLILDNRGRARGALGRREEAVADLRRAAEGIETHYGPEHLRTGKALMSLSIVLGDVGDLEAAAANGQRAVEIFETRYASEDHPQLQYARNNLAILLWKERRFAEAEPVFKDILESVRRTHGEDHPYTAAVMNNYGLILLELERYDEARAWTERALALRERVLAADHPDVAVSILNLARLDLATGRADEAEAGYRRGIAIRQSRLGRDHSSLEGPLRGHARALRVLGRDAEANAQDARADAMTAVAAN